MSLDVSVASISRQYGFPHTLRRSAAAAGANAWTAGSETVTYSDCTGRERYFSPKELGGGIEEGDALVTMDAASFPDGVVPQKGDRLALGFFTALTDGEADWRQIVNVYPAKVRGVTVAYKIQVRA